MLTAACTSASGARTPHIGSRLGCGGCRQRSARISACLLVGRRQNLNDLCTLSALRIGEQTHVLRHHLKRHDLPPALVGLGADQLLKAVLHPAAKDRAAVPRIPRDVVSEAIHRIGRGAHLTSHTIITTMPHIQRMTNADFSCVGQTAHCPLELWQPSRSPSPVACGRRSHREGLTVEARSGMRTPYGPITAVRSQPWAASYVVMGTPHIIPR
jgi:hypothetical protein